MHTQNIAIYYPQEDEVKAAHRLTVISKNSLITASALNE